MRIEREDQEYIVPAGSPETFKLWKAHAQRGGDLPSNRKARRRLAKVRQVKRRQNSSEGDRRDPSR